MAFPPGDPPSAPLLEPPLLPDPPLLLESPSAPPSLFAPLEPPEEPPELLVAPLEPPEEPPELLVDPLELPAAPLELPEPLLVPLEPLEVAPEPPELPEPLELLDVPSAGDPVPELPQADIASVQAHAAAQTATIFPIVTVRIALLLDRWTQGPGGQVALPTPRTETCPAATMGSRHFFGCVAEAVNAPPTFPTVP
jgi:hypothetical protein